MLKASVSPQKESGASFDEEMALLPAVVFCLICGGVSIEAAPDFSVVCQIAIKIW